MRIQSSWLTKGRVREAERKNLTVVTLTAAFCTQRCAGIMNVPCVIGDLIENTHCISNMLERELLAYWLSESQWLSFLGLRAYFPRGCLGKKEIYE